MAARKHSVFEPLLALVDEIAIIMAIIILILLFLGGSGLISWNTIIIIITILAVSLTLLAIAVLKVHRRRPAVGTEAMIGLRGTVVEDLDPEGLILIEGELWKARARSKAIKKGSKVRVVGVRGIILEVVED